MKLLDSAYLHSILLDDSTSSTHLRWRSSGKTAGSIRANGYVVVEIESKCLPVARVLLCMRGVPVDPKATVVYLNGCKSDLSPANLILDTAYKDTLRVCKSCNEKLPLAFFRADIINNNTVLWRWECKQCGANKATSRWRGMKPAEKLWKSAKSRAARTGVLFTITQQDIMGVWQERCPYLDIPIKPDSGSKHDSPSLDRIVPEKGYTKGNIVVCSWVGNAIKGAWSSEQLNASPVLQEFNDRIRLWQN